MKKKTVRRQNRSNRRTKRVNVKRRKSKKMRRMRGGATTEQIGAAAQLREVINAYIFENDDKGIETHNDFHLLLSNLNRIVHCGKKVQVKKKAHDFYDNREYKYDHFAEQTIRNAERIIMNAQAEEVIELLRGEQAQLELAREKALRSNPNPGVPASRPHSRSPLPQSRQGSDSRSPPPQPMQGSYSPASSSRSSFSSGSLASSSRSSSSSPVPPSPSDSRSLAPTPLDLDNFPILGRVQPSSRTSMSRSPPPTPRP